MEQPIFLEYFIANTTGNGFLIQMLLNGVALLISANFIKGIHLKNFVSALIVGVILAVLNATLGAFMDFLTTPIRWLTLGLFAFIIDAIVIKIAAHFLDNFRVDGFVPALFLAIALSIFNLVFFYFIMIK